jgi:hypothetical protein
MSITNVRMAGCGIFSCLSRKFSCLNPLAARVLSLGLLAAGLLAAAFIAHYYRTHRASLIANRTPPNPIPNTVRPGEERKSYSDGREEVGVFRGGVLTSGDKRFPNTQTAREKLIRGSFDSAGRLHGQGKIEYWNGITIEGEFNHGVLVRGSKNYPNPCRDHDSGNIIPFLSMEGTFDAQGRLHGEQCKVVSTDGSECEGRFDKGVFISGVQRFKEGAIASRQGTFDRDGVLHGPNCIETLRDRTVFTGTFDKGSLVDGNIVYQSGEIRKREGTFVSGLLEGISCSVEYFDGRRLSGRFVGNKLVEGTREFVTAVMGGRRRETGNFTTPEAGQSVVHGKDCTIEFFGGNNWTGTINENGEFTKGIKRYTEGTNQDIVSEDGTFVNNVLRNGTITYRTGKTVEGTFNPSGEWDGEMTINEAGKTSQGTYQSGILRGQLNEIPYFNPPIHSHRLHNHSGGFDPSQEMQVRQ